MKGPTETSIGIQSEIKPINPKSYWTIKSSGDSLSGSSTTDTCEKVEMSILNSSTSTVNVQTSLPNTKMINTSILKDKPNKYVYVSVKVPGNFNSIFELQTSQVFKSHVTIKPIPSNQVGF